MVKTMLEECYCSCLEKGITSKLVNLSLHTIKEKSNKVEMHDLIQQMDMTIALSNTFKSDEEKRLLVEEDGMDVLNGNNVTTICTQTLNMYINYKNNFIIFE